MFSQKLSNWSLSWKQQENKNKYVRVTWGPQPRLSKLNRGKGGESVQVKRGSWRGGVGKSRLLVEGEKKVE